MGGVFFIIIIFKRKAIFVNSFRNRSFQDFHTELPAERVNGPL
jgi:hypothetical protein